jgi:hypothetical protein
MEAGTGQRRKERMPDSEWRSHQEGNEVFKTYSARK